ncbi:hypothetical protein F2Q69_00052642 [Brassica cretica]|uniref:Uncharacterized protein n=1 Tax=Brassica cretica TaxID=69181 RepID=A0A8S9MV92_BRACR|nr:hypothetical protein F2Q69_00052642 [Brassica cretica]
MITASVELSSVTAPVYVNSLSVLLSKFIALFLNLQSKRNLNITHKMKKIKFQSLFISAWRLFSYKGCIFIQRSESPKLRQMASSGISFSIKG